MAPAPPAGPCTACGALLTVQREEAVLDLEVQGLDAPRLFLDVTVRHGVPGDEERLAAAAAFDGAVNKEAERDKQSRYPSGQSPWPALPLAQETFGRLGRTALSPLRNLARRRALALP